MSDPEIISASGEPLQPPLSHRIRVLVLQHPQEQREGLGSAKLLVDSLSAARRRVGLSWPSLRAAWGADERLALQPANWSVLYLGARSQSPAPSDPVLTFLDRKGEPLDDQAEARRGIQGLVLLDGTWAQAKTLWWRNAWLLKLRRIVLNPREPSRYGDLRREPRQGALSTLEAGALALAELGAPPSLRQELLLRFNKLLASTPNPQIRSTPRRMPRKRA